jgi:NAD-dependent dihydropyrimidine dehydrogenase PreA subunit/glutaredoxin
MAMAWYPVVDYMVCIECGTCIAKCPHGVYDAAKAPTPVVIRPGECVDHCHGCGNRCPVGAITYVGDDTGWTPPNGKAEEEHAACGCVCGEVSEKKVVVEFLYLDLDTCDRCVGTDHALGDVMMVLTPALELAGFEVEYNKVEMATAEIAKQYQFLSSPTIRVNGIDIGGPVQENSCGCCSEISGADADCRVFKYGGQLYEVPPKEMLAESVLRAVFGETANGNTCGEYVLPGNLKTFYEGKSRQSCSCGRTRC